MYKTCLENVQALVKQPFLTFQLMLDMEDKSIAWAFYLAVMSTWQILWSSVQEIGSFCCTYWTVCVGSEKKDSTQILSKNSVTDTNMDSSSFGQDDALWCKALFRLLFPLAVSAAREGKKNCIWVIPTITLTLTHDFCNLSSMLYIQTRTAFIALTCMIFSNQMLTCTA